MSAKPRLGFGSPRAELGLSVAGVHALEEVMTGRLTVGDRVGVPDWRGVSIRCVVEEAMVRSIHDVFDGGAEQHLYDCTRRPRGSNGPEGAPPGLFFVKLGAFGSHE